MPPLIQIDFVGGSIQLPVGVETWITPFCEYINWCREWVCCAFSLRDGQCMLTPTTGACALSGLCAVWRDSDISCRYSANVHEFHISLSGRERHSTRPEREIWNSK